MKKLIKIILTVSLIFVCIPLISQDRKETTDQGISNTADAETKIEKRRIFSIGIGINLGFFYSEDINNYIRVASRIGQSTTVVYGSSDMFLGFTPVLSINIMPIKYLNIQVLGEIRWAPKFITGSGVEDRLINYVRYSPGVIISGYLPLGSSERVGLLLGAGCFYHFMRFEYYYNSLENRYEGYSADSLGFRGQFGLRIDFHKLSIDILLSYDYAPANASNGSSVKMNLGDHGGNIGTLVSFKIF